MSNSSASPPPSNSSASPPPSKKKNFRFNEKVNTRPIASPYMTLNAWGSKRWSYEKNPNYTDDFVPGKRVGANFTTSLREPGPILDDEQLIDLYRKTHKSVKLSHIKGVGGITHQLKPATLHEALIPHDDLRYEKLLHRNRNRAKESNSYKTALATSFRPAYFKGEIIHDEEARNINESRKYPVSIAPASLADAYAAQNLKNEQERLSRNLSTEVNKRNIPQRNRSSAMNATNVDPLATNFDFEVNRPQRNRSSAMNATNVDPLATNFDFEVGNKYETIKGMQIKINSMGKQYEQGTSILIPVNVTLSRDGKDMPPEDLTIVYDPQSKRKFLYDQESGEDDPASETTFEIFDKVSGGGRRRKQTRRQKKNKKAKSRRTTRK